MTEWTRALPFSRSYLVIVIAVAAVVSGLALFGQSSTLALAAAILGLYVLHLFSNWQLASNQRQQWQTLREVERMLGALDGEQRGPAPERTAASGPRAEEESEGPLTAVGGDPNEPGSGARSDDELAADDVSAETSDSGIPADGTPTTAGENGGPAAGAVDEAEEEEENEDTVLVPRQYRLGTVAVVMSVLTPGEVARVLAVQNRQPERQFGDIGVDLDLLAEDEVQELLEVQRRGLYRPEAISRARRDLKQYRRQKAEELRTGP